MTRGRPPATASSRAASAWRRAALLRGETVHWPDTRLHYNRKAIRERYGLLLRWESDGRGGRFWWAEEPPRSDAERPLAS